MFSNYIVMSLKLSMQRAMLGEVTCNLLALTCGVTDNVIKVVAYYQGPVTEEDMETLRRITTQVIADFPDFTIEEEALSSNDREPTMLDFWTFMKAKHQPR